MPDPVYYINTDKNPNIAPGYTQRAYVASKSWFRVISGHDTEDTTVISAAHAFYDGFDFIYCYAQPNSVKMAGNTSGEEGAVNSIWKPEIFFPGDSAELQQMLEVLKNDDLIFLVEDAHLAGSGHFTQFGDKLMPCHISAMTVASGTVYGNEKKGWRVELIAACKYLYTKEVHRRFGQRFGFRFR